MEKAGSGVLARIESFLRKHVTLARTFAVAFIFVEEVYLGVLRWLAMKLWQAVIVPFGQQPMGTGVAVLVIALIGAAWWAAVDPVRLRRERKDRSNATIQQRLREEMEVLRVRELWVGSEKPRVACEKAASLVNEIARYLRVERKESGAGLFAGRATTLTDCVTAFSRVLEPADGALQATKARLRELVGAYWDCAASINLCVGKYPDLAEQLNTENKSKLLDSWRESHKHLAEMIVLLRGRDMDYKRIGHVPEDSAHLRFQPQ